MTLFPVPRSRHTMREYSFRGPFGVRLHPSDCPHAKLFDAFPVGEEVLVTAQPADCPLDAEGYRLTLNEKSDRVTAVLAYGDRRGLLYGLFTVVKMLEANCFLIGELDDAPGFRIRGYIEGFYGRPWSREIRPQTLRRMAYYGANTHYYAPKDDPYHRRLWREKYPADALRELRALRDAAAAFEMEFAYCIAPGLSIQYTADADFTALTEKCKQLYDIGIRSFGLLLDDIPPTLYYEADKEKFGTPVRAHIDLVNRFDRFLRTCGEPCVLTVCPTEYCGNADGGYLTTLGQSIPSHVRLFFTGADICSKEITAREARAFQQATRHRPLYWDNYPVNDAEMFMEMHLGPLLGREKTLGQYAEGEIFNCMEYALATRIPLTTALCYLWNPAAYEPEEAFRHAVEANIPPAEREAFLLLADHLRTSCLKDENSKIMGRVLQNVLAAAEAGDTDSAARLYREYLRKMEDAAALLRDRTDGIYGELRLWTEKFLHCVRILRLVDDILFGARDCRDALYTEMLRYNRDAPVLTAFCFRELVETALGAFTY